MVKAILTTAIIVAASVIGAAGLGQMPHPGVKLVCLISNPGEELEMLWFEAQNIGSMPARLTIRHEVFNASTYSVNQAVLGPGAASDFYASITSMGLFNPEHDTRHDSFQGVGSSAAVIYGALMSRDRDTDVTFLRRFRRNSLAREPSEKHEVIVHVLLHKASLAQSVDVPLERTKVVPLVTALKAKFEGERNRAGLLFVNAYERQLRERITALRSPAP